MFFTASKDSSAKWFLRPKTPPPVIPDKETRPEKPFVHLVDIVEEVRIPLAAPILGARSIGAVSHPLPRDGRNGPRNPTQFNGRTIQWFHGRPVKPASDSLRSSSHTSGNPSSGSDTRVVVTNVPFCVCDSVDELCYGLFGLKLNCAQVRGPTLRPFFVAWRPFFFCLTGAEKFCDLFLVVWKFF